MPIAGPGADFLIPELRWPYSSPSWHASPWKPWWHTQRAADAALPLARSHVPWPLQLSLQRGTITSHAAPVHSAWHTHVPWLQVP